MSGKIVASYLVRLTVREPEDAESNDAEAPEIPTNDAVAAALLVGLSPALGNLVATAESERTDR